MMKLETAASLPRPSLASLPHPVMGDYLSDVSLRHCIDPAEIDQIRHLREGIDLSIHTATPEGEREFRQLEKKETNSASHSPSNLTARRSARSASCRWVCN